MTSVQQVGWHNLTVPPSLQISANGNVYLFNVGQNTQRFRFEHGLSIGKLSNILLTDTSSCAIDGLPGLMFALEATAIEKLTIFGPPPTKRIVHYIYEHFLKPTKYEIGVIEVDNTQFVEILKENGITIYATIYMQECNSENCFNFPACSDTKAAYTIICDDSPGMFRVDEALKLGLKQGAAFGRLKQGQPVQTDAGTWVYPHQVVSETLKGKTVLVSHDNGATSSDIIERTKEITQNLDYLFWMVTKESPNQMQKLLPNCALVPCDMSLTQAEHLLMLPSAYYRNKRLHEYAPQLYPSLTTREQHQLSTEVPGLNSNGSHYEFAMTPPLSKYIIGPANKIRIEEERVLYRDPQELSTQPDGAMPHIEDTLMQNPALTFLGTGCASPSPLRNVAGIILQITDDSALLLDAGEGSLQQLYLISRSLDDFIKTLCGIELVFVSHCHADHYLGLGSILAYRKMYARCSQKKWLQFYNQSISPIDYNCIVARSNMTYETTMNEAALQLQTFEVQHIEDSFGVKLTHPDIGTIVYSGDTRPCETVIEASKGCDILIHEATFLDEQLQEAIKRCHTTLTEALQISGMCNVGTLVTTHFSQRYQAFETHFQSEASNVIFAYDLLRVPLKAVKQLAAPLLRAMQKLKSEEPKIAS